MRIYVLLPLFFLLALFCLLQGGLGQISDENTRVLAALGSGAKAPIFNAYFPNNPVPSVSATLNYTWLEVDPNDNSSVQSYHTGLSSLSGALTSYIDVNTATGPTSCGVTLPQIGGPGSGTGATQGWSVDIVVKLTSAQGGWAKLIDFGDGNAIGNTTNDLMITWDGNDNNETYLIPGLAAQQLSSLPPTTNYDYASCPMIKPLLNEWYHIALIMQAVDVNAASATWFIYINGQLLPYGTNLQAGTTFTSFQGANLPLPVARPQSYIGRSDYGDPSLAAIFDAVRVYDYALSATQVSALAAAYNLNTGVSLPQPSNDLSLPTTSETNYWQYAGIPRAPVLNAVFPANPTAAVGGQLNYQWSASDSSDTNATIAAYHQGVVQLNGGANSFVDLTKPTGPNSAGLVMGSFGGAGSGSGSSQGWSVELVVKPTGNLPYSKLLTIGNGGYLDVLYLGWDNAGGNLTIEQTSNVNVNLPNTNGQTDLILSNVNFIIGQWYHIAIVQQPTNLTTFVGTWSVYVNGALVASVASPATYPVPTYRDQTYVGASDYQDPNAQATYDAVRVYDIALSAQQVQLMAQQYGLSSGGTLVNPNGGSSVLSGGKIAGALIGFVVGTLLLFL